MYSFDGILLSEVEAPLVDTPFVPSWTPFDKLSPDGAMPLSDLVECDDSATEN